MFSDKTVIVYDRTESVSAKLQRYTTGQFADGQSRDQDQDSGRVGEISNMFDIFLSTATS